MTDTVLAKVASIQRCILRAREIFRQKQEDFLSDFDAQDIVVLNILRACELSIDLANHLIREKRLGLPKSSADSFLLLAQGGIISTVLAEHLGKMVGFRNISVHEYKAIDYEVVIRIVKVGLEDVISFTEKVLEVD
jgi:uncharacterized protein YutE (UPF0331/DUF86 family)